MILKMIKTFLVCFLPGLLAAQIPTACGGGASPATACEQACISCNFNGFSGTTIGFPGGVVPDFCGTVENMQWLGFIAGSGNATFTVTPNNCINGDGLQIALYSDCSAPPLSCNKGKKDGGTIPVSVAAPLTPGSNYFLLVDGYAGDFCEFTITVDPPEAVFEPPLGLVGDISGPNQGCPGATFTYSVAPVFGASFYIWDGPPGTLVDSMPVPARIPGGTKVSVTLGNTSGKICVQAANVCKENPTCTSSIDVEILPDSYRPKIVVDTTRGLSCIGEPVILAPEVQPENTPYTYAWTADSLGQISGNANGKSVSVNQVGAYTVIVNNTLNGCSASETIRVGEPEPPVLAAAGIQHVRCYGETNGIIRIEQVQNGLPPFLYALDSENFVNMPEFRNLPAGEHHLRIQAADGCETDTLLTVLQPDEWLLNLGADSTIGLGTAIRLWSEDYSSDPARIRVLRATPDELSALLCDTCSYCPLYSFRYSVTLIDSSGCTASDSRELVVRKDRNVYIPNVFSPDKSSAENTRFTVFGGNDVALVNFLRVYNRWGKLVHEAHDFSGADPTTGWDGLVNGKIVEPGVYTYQTEVSFKDGQTEVYFGTVTLVR